MPSKSKTSSFAIEAGSDVKALQKAVRVLAEPDAPFLRDALNEIGHDLKHAVAGRAPGSMASKTDFAGVKGSAARLSATVIVKHPGAKSMEFGRKYWKVQGRKVAHSPGQPARPYIGIKDGGHALGAVEPQARKQLMDAIEREWENIGGGD